MKLSLVIALFASFASAEEGNIRKRELQSAGGSVRVRLCFSEESSVQVFGSGSMSIKDLQIGDRIFNGETYEPVYAFGHLNADDSADFVQIKTALGNTLEATGAHLVFVDGKSDAVRADAVQVGDALQGATVTEISSVNRKGLYAPLTPSGKLVVDGVTASNYVALESMENDAIFQGNLHAFAHVGISPFRLLCTKVSSKMCEYHNEEGIPVILDGMHQAFELMVGLSPVFKLVVLALYLTVAAAAWTMECILMAPVVASLVALGFVATKTMGVQIKADKIKSV